MKTNEFFTASEIAEMFKVERRTVIRWISAGKLKAFKPGCGRFWRIRERDLKIFIKGEKHENKKSYEAH